jgi:hypothetical protein
LILFLYKGFINDFRSEGFYIVKLNGYALASGIYMYNIKACKHYTVKKMMILK